MATVRAKFNLSYAKHLMATNYKLGEDGKPDYKQPEQVEVVEFSFGAVSGGTPEDDLFGKATPMGQITMTIYNPHAIEAFATRLGKKFYVDFTPAE